MVACADRSSSSTSSTACSSARRAGAIRGTRNTLEWTAPSPPGHGNFDFQPIVYRGPYEYGSPEVTKTTTRKTQPPPAGDLQTSRRAKPWALQLTCQCDPVDRQTQLTSDCNVTDSDDVTNSIAPGRIAWPWRLCCATFPLIWVGGLVTTYDAGMAVPDWPSTYGYNLFLYPWTEWLAGPWDLFIEHGHRLLGAAVGLLTHRASSSSSGAPIAGAGCALRRLAALALVIVQGVLGGMRVSARRAHAGHDPRLRRPAVLRLLCALGDVHFAALAARTPPTETQQRLRASRRRRICSPRSGLLHNSCSAHSLRHIATRCAPATFRVLAGFPSDRGRRACWSCDSACWRLRRGRSQRCAAGCVGRRLRCRAGRCCSLRWARHLGRQVRLAGLARRLRLARPTSSSRAKSQLQADITTAHVAVGSLILAIGGHDRAAFAARLARAEASVAATSFARDWRPPHEHAHR